LRSSKKSWTRKLVIVVVMESMKAIAKKPRPASKQPARARRQTRRGTILAGACGAGAHTELIFLFEVAVD